MFPSLLRVEANDSEFSEAQFGPWCLPDKVIAKGSKLTVRRTTEISYFVGSGSRWVERGREDDSRHSVHPVHRVALPWIVVLTCTGNQRRRDEKLSHISSPGQG